MTDVKKTTTPSIWRDETIAASATAYGSAALALLRISGPQAFSFSQKLLKVNGKTLSELKYRHSYYADVCTEEGVLDDVVATFFKGPNSYTGEDLVEISCHGSPYITQEILKQYYQLGCRPADPGEFTKRAYLNGRMDLTKAEGIKELIEAQSSAQWFAARQLADGRLSDEINALRKKLIESLAYLEAQIDFPDEGDTAHLHLGFVDERVKDVTRRCEELVSSFASGHIAAFGPAVVICGVPNAGKSTLLNELLGKERAIVTDIAGTTRDYIEESCLVNGRYIRLIDTAGIRQTDATVEKMGIEQARKLVAAADLVLFLNPSDQDPKAWDELDSELESLPDESVLRILTKADLQIPTWGKDFLKLSCAKREGISELKAKIANFVDEHAARIKERPFITTARHAEALKQALEGLRKFYSGRDEHAAEELLAFELQEVVRSLQSIIGVVEQDDILDKIFSEFCVGK